jgi:hypothetical protein
VENPETLYKPFGLNILQQIANFDSARFSPFIHQPISTNFRSPTPKLRRQAEWPMIRFATKRRLN